MPNWKKLIVSGSDASLTNLQLTDLNPIEDDTVLVIDSSGNVGTKESAASSGTSGNSGSSGTSGNSGSSGTSGNSGSSGTSGNSGSSGTSGVDGDDGSDGSSGTSGNSGSSGTSGNSGSSGTSGNSGSSGTSGNDGADGILPLSGNTANGVITYDGDGTGTVESTLTYNANQLNVSGGNSTQWNTSYGWGDHSIVGYVSSSGNTIIGTDADINTLGATIIDNLYMTDGVITSHGTRVLTKGDLELENVNNTTDLLKPISTATQTALNLKANLSSPTFTGTVIAPTPISNDSSTKVATTAYVQGEITDLIGGAGAAFDTLLEISASIANGDSDVVALTTTVSGKLQKDQNLSDLTNAGTARTNLGLGGLATLNTVNAATITDNSVGAAELNVVGNGTTTQFLRSDADGTFTWATPTDTNTQLTDTQVRSKFSAGTNVAISTAGVISSTDTNTTYAIGDGGLTTKDFTAALKTKLDALDSSTYLKSNADDSFSGGLVSTARDKGIFGTYDSTKTDHIWSMGTAYKNHASGTNFGNLYGLAYKHTNNTTGGTMAGGHQMVWASNGTPKSAMGDNIWTAGTVTATGGNSTQWNTAYNWGNHASAGYLTSYTDTNTTYSAGRGLDISGTEFQLETDLRDSISYIGYDSNDYIQWSNNGWTRTVVNGTERLRVDTAGIDVSGRAIIDTNLTVGVSNIVGSGAVLTGGSSNVNGGYLSTIAGGTLNLNCQHYGTIAGGYLNGLCTNYSGNGYSFIGAGACNIIKSGLWSAIVSGCNNKILTQGSIDGCQGNFIGGGNNNYIMANNRSSIVGGCQNNIYDQSHGSIIGGGHVNAINDSEKSIIGGGLANYIVNGCHQTIGGGAYNQISSPCETAGNTISGGECNQICQGYQSNHNTIAGGCNNQICTYYHGNNFIGGGNSNCIQASYGASNSIIGGYNNKVYSGCYSAIIGGSSISAYSSNYVYVPNLCNVGGGTSDCRLKESICNIPYGLSHVSQLEPVSYKFTSDESKATKYGFLAQCVQEIMPDLITNHPTALVDGTPVLQFDKDAIWSSMVNAIKDLKNEVDALKARIDILEA